jgi:hypothetical protein
MRYLSSKSAVLYRYKVLKCIATPIATPLKCCNEIKHL